MKEIRAIYIFSSDKILWKQIYPIIESELQEELKAKYHQVPEDSKLVHYVKTVSYQGFL